MQLAQSEKAKSAYQTVCELQKYFAEKLSANSIACDPSVFQRIEWLRSEGTFGGGHRLTAVDGSVFNRASINISQVQYENAPDKKLNSATALSTIIHFENPHVPSIHLHISWTEFKDHSGYWRIMADLNPSLPNTDDTHEFLNSLKSVSGQHFENGVSQGEKYFYIPALKRHRGVAHFYLEGFNTGDFNSDMEFAHRFGKKIIDTYVQIAEKALVTRKDITESHLQKQLQYHTLYFFQVLTLDRGTIAGLLVHNENDVGILASLPKHVGKEHLSSWMRQMDPLPARLLENIVKVLPDENKCLVDDRVKTSICDVIRSFYSLHPDAMRFLASGDVLPESNVQHESRT